MDNESCKLLFDALSQILRNQQAILRHLGIARYDSEWGWNDDATENMIRDCDCEANKFE